MWLNLSSVWVPTKSKTFNKVLRDIEPIQVWVSCFMRIHVSCGAIEFTKDGDFFNFVYLPSKSVSEIGELLTDSTWCSTLAMGPTHHWNLRILICKLR